MKNDLCEIFIDRLRRGEVEEIQLTLPPSFLGVEEENFRYLEDLKVKGEAYLADEMLIFSLAIRCEAEMPCSICNEWARFNIEVANFYHAVPTSEIKGAVFQYGDLVRESLLLETPHFVECHEGKCPRRKDVAKYLQEDEGYRPFTDLIKGEQYDGSTT